MGQSDICSYSSRLHFLIFAKFVLQSGYSWGLGGLEGVARGRGGRDSLSLSLCLRIFFSVYLYSCVKPDHRETASVIMTWFLTMGLLAGAALSFLFTNLVKF